jgi:hypothetical protein
MQAKRPIRHLGWSANDLCVLPCRLCRVGLATSQEIEIEYATDDVVLERGSARARALAPNLHVHARRAAEEDGVRAAVRTVLKVHGVHAIQVRALRDAIRIARPQRARRVLRAEAERLRVLAEAVEVRRGRERRLEAQVLRLEHERVPRARREEHLARARARDVEREGRVRVRELDLRRRWRRVGVGRGLREDRVGDLVARARRVGYLEVDACFCKVGEGWNRVTLLRFAHACANAVAPVSYTTVRSRTSMSFPNTLQGVPARTSLAVSVEPSTFMAVALYPGQASNTAGSTSSARATSVTAPRKENSASSLPHRLGARSIVELGTDNRGPLAFIYSG